jgi:hypothetical protein
MPQFLVESPHTQEDCDKMIKMTQAMGYLTHYYWGCKVGDHRGWAMIEAENPQEALLSVPPLIRHKSKAIEIVQFNAHDVERW